MDLVLNIQGSKMDDDSFVSFKVYLHSNDSYEPEIRRFGLHSNLVTSYSFFMKRITEVFPKLTDKAFTITWKDEEGDDVIVSSDDELLIALTSMNTDVKKFFIRVQPPMGGAADKEGTVLHPGVYCDGCEANIVGYRYKCLVCRDYDLCGGCEQSGIHSEHIMLRIPDPYCFDHMNIRKLTHFIKSFIPEMKHHDAEHLYSCKKRRRYEKRRSCPMSEVNQDSPHIKYMEWGLGALQKLLDPLGGTVEIHVSGKPEEKEKEEKKEEKTGEKKEESKDAKQKASPTASGSAQKEVRLPNAQEISEAMKKKIDEITKILASQTVNNGAEDDGWVAFEELKKATEEPRPSTSSQDAPKNAQSQASAPPADGEQPQTSQTNLYPNLAFQPRGDSAEDRVKEALQQMISMGFTNEGGWLTSLVEAKKGDINKVLEVLVPYKKTQ